MSPRQLIWTKVTNHSIPKNIKRKGVFLSNPFEKELIELEVGPLDEPMIQRYVAATGIRHFDPVPPVVITAFRQAEYEWLKKLSITKNLLHGEQDYEYFSPLPTGKKLKVRSQLKSYRERNRGNELWKFMTIESEFFSDGKRCVVSKTTFIVRDPVEVA